jgi:glycosyltransferase involved in cell wall biosynthesis
LLLAIERRVARMSDAVIGITADFEQPLLGQSGAARYATIPLWGVLAETPLRPHDNPWAHAQDLAGTTNLIYAGTLGLKHNPALLLELARALRGMPQVRVVVCSEGQGADWLRDRAGDLDNLVLLPFQAYEDLPDVLGAADILLAVLEPDAGVYSVPSKVLTNLCAGRPQLLAVPGENLAGRIVAEAGAGTVVPPDDVTGFIAGAQAMLADEDRRGAAGTAARRWAEAHFRIEAIASMFENILRGERPEAVVARTRSAKTGS